MEAPPPTIGDKTWGEIREKRGPGISNGERFGAGELGNQGLGAESVKNGAYQYFAFAFEHLSIAEKNLMLTDYGDERG